MLLLCCNRYYCSWYCCYITITTATVSAGVAILPSIVLLLLLLYHHNFYYMYYCRCCYDSFFIFFLLEIDITPRTSPGGMWRPYKVGVKWCYRLDWIRVVVRPNAMQLWYNSGKRVKPESPRHLKAILETVSKHTCVLPRTHKHLAYYV